MFDVAVSGDGIAARAISLAALSMGLSVVQIGPKDPHYEEDLRAYALDRTSLAVLKALSVKLSSEDVMRVEFCIGEKLRAPFVTLADQAPLMVMADHNEIALAFRRRLDEKSRDLDVRYERIEQTLIPQPRETHVELGPDLHARLFVIAEGRASQNAKRLGISYSDYDYRQSAVVAKLEGTISHYQTARQVFTKAGPLGVLPHGTHAFSIVWACARPDAEYLTRAPEGEFVSALSELLGGYYGDVHLITDRESFPLHHLVADRIITDRTVLIADSAHRLHPMAGQGLNFGLRDVAHLAETLAWNHRLGLDIGAPSILEGYARKRRGDLARMTVFSRGFNRLRSMNGIASTAGRWAAPVLGSWFSNTIMALQAPGTHSVLFDGRLS